MCVCFCLCTCFCVYLCVCVCLCTCFSVSLCVCVCFFCALVSVRVCVRACVRVEATICFCWWHSHLYGFSSQAQLEVSHDAVGARELPFPVPSLPALLSFSLSAFLIPSNKWRMFRRAFFLIIPPSLSLFLSLSTAQYISHTLYGIDS